MKTTIKMMCLIALMIMPIASLQGHETAVSSSVGTKIAIVAVDETDIAILYTLASAYADYAGNIDSIDQPKENILGPVGYMVEITVGKYVDVEETAKDLRNFLLALAGRCGVSGIFDVGVF